MYGMSCADGNDTGIAPPTALLPESITIVDVLSVASNRRTRCRAMSLTSTVPSDSARTTTRGPSVSVDTAVTAPSERTGIFAEAADGCATAVVAAMILIATLARPTRACRNVNCFVISQVYGSRGPKVRPPVS